MVVREDENDIGSVLAEHENGQKQEDEHLSKHTS
jgi:hypothetical protein